MMEDLKFTAIGQMIPFDDGYGYLSNRVEIFDADKEVEIHKGLNSDVVIESFIYHHFEARTNSVYKKIKVRRWYTFWLYLHSQEIATGWKQIIIADCKYNAHKVTINKNDPLVYLISEVKTVTKDIEESK